MTLKPTLGYENSSLDILSWQDKNICKSYLHMGHKTNPWVLHLTYNNNSDTA